MTLNLRALFLFAGGLLAAAGCGPLIIVGAAGVAAGVGTYATLTNQGVQDRNWQSYAPEDSWTKVAQTTVTYGPNPVQAAMGQPTMSPFGLSSTDVH
jgi:hypothetical protein